MITTDIERIIQDGWEIGGDFFDRESYDIPLRTGQMVTLVGPRRSGKTFLLYQTMRKLTQSGVPYQNLLFVNFEDDRLTLDAQAGDQILTTFQRMNRHTTLKDCYLFFDEIQNLPNWDRFLRRIYDTVTTNIFVTGSNSNLLSREIATHLKGRTLERLVYPFSFQESCAYSKINWASPLPTDQHNREVRLRDYLTYGGFPALLPIENPHYKIEILQGYFDSMLLRDIVDRYHVKNVTALRFFLKRLVRCNAKTISVNKITQELASAGISCTKDTLYDFLRYAQDSYFAFCVPKYMAKDSDSLIGSKKLYLSDPGYHSALSMATGHDLGQKMEQVVFLELLRRKKEVRFYKETYECDFLVQSRGSDVWEAVQVCYSIEEEDTLNREIRGLVAACHALKLKTGTIITLETRDAQVHSNVEVQIQPLADWLLGN